MNVPNGENNFSLIPRPPTAVEKAEPGAKRVMAVMVSDALAIAQQQLTPVRAAPTQAEIESWWLQGTNYFYGHGVAQNYAEAVKWYRRAAEQGCLFAEAPLGECYARGLGVPQNYKEAIRWFRKAAEHGGPGAGYVQTCLGYCYVQGLGAPNDFGEAAKWYRVVATDCFACGEAQIALGLLHLFGLGVSTDSVESAKWFAEATDWSKRLAEHLVAFFKDHMRLPFNLDKVIPCLQEAAEKGDILAQLFLGVCYQQGWFVRPFCLQGKFFLPGENHKEAAKWFKKLAEQGNAEAQYRLAWCYFDSDKPEHVKWLRKAAAQGHRRARMGRALRGAVFAGVPLE